MQLWRALRPVLVLGVMLLASVTIRVVAPGGGQPRGAQGCHGCHFSLPPGF